MAALLGLVLAAPLVPGQATLVASAPVTPAEIISGPLDGPLAAFTANPNPPNIFISGVAGGVPASVPFKLSRVVPAAANIFFLSASSWTTPATLTVGVNQSALVQNHPGLQFIELYFSTTDQSPASEALVLLNVGLIAPPPPLIQSVLSTASYQPTISPGEIVSIFGANLAPPRGSTAYGITGTYPTTLGDGTVSGDTTVTFNGIAAPLLYVGPGQINATVPYEVAGQKTVNVVVTRYFLATAPFSIALTDTSPGIFTATQNGSGQGAILNVPPNTPNDLTAYTYNSAANPAPKGSVIEFFATGIGVWSPTVPDGGINLVATKFSAQPVSLTIGGKPATIYYAGSAPYEVWGTLQIIAYVPSGIGSGPQPLVITIGQNDNSKQDVTVAVE